MKSITIIQKTKNMLEYNFQSRLPEDIIWPAYQLSVEPVLELLNYQLILSGLFVRQVEPTIAS